MPEMPARDGKLACWIMACKFKIEARGLPQTRPIGHVTPCVAPLPMAVQWFQWLLA